MQQAVEAIKMLTQSDTTRCKQQWRDFVKAHCDEVFQTALLLTADATAAEAAVTRSIDSLDISSAPEHADLAAWEKAVVVRSLETSQPPSPTPNSTTRSMLQPGLPRVIQIERLPRICFVLRMLLGYSTPLCAQILGVEESEIRMLFQMAALQLQQKVAGKQEPWSR